MPRAPITLLFALGALAQPVHAGTTPPRPTGTLAFGTGQYVFAVRADGGGGHALRGGDYPAFARDGRLAFTLNGVWVAQSNGRAARHIVPRFAEYLTYAYPAWSPDGTSLAYVRVDNGHETAELWTVRADGTRLHGMTIVHVASSPSWSPDGKWIAYAGDGGLSEVLADGSGKRLLVRGDVVAAAWSPDGRSIAFEEERGKRVTLARFDIAGNRVVELATLGSAGPVAWSPNSRWLAYTVPHTTGALPSVEVRALRLADKKLLVITRSYDVQRVDGLAWRR